MSTKLDFEHIFERFRKDNEKDWEHDRTKTVGASEVFGCIRKNFFSRHPDDYSTDDGKEQRWGAAARGDLIENFHFVPAMYNFIDQDLIHTQHQDGVNLIGAGDSQKTFVSGKLSATPDGLLIGLEKDALANYGIEDIESEEVALEIKSIDPRVNLEAEKEIHHGQVQTQLGLIRENTNFKPMYAVIVYIDCSFFDDISVFVVKYDEKKYKTAKKRAESVFIEGKKPTDFLAEGKLMGTCDYCDYRKECAKASQEAMPDGVNDLSDGDKKTLDAMITTERSAAKQKKAAEDSHKKIRSAISEFLKDKKTKSHKSEIASVSLSWNKGRKSFDQSSLKEDLLELQEKFEEANVEADFDFSLDEYYKEGDGYETLRITEK